MQIKHDIVGAIRLGAVCLLAMVASCLPLSAQSQGNAADSLQGIKWLERAVVLEDVEHRCDEAIVLYRKCLPIFQKCGYMEGYFKAKIGIAYSYSESGRPDEAKSQIIATIKEMEAMPAQKVPTMKLGDAWLAKGNIHYTQFEFEPAVAGFEKALAIYQQLPDSYEKKEKVQAYAYNNLASINLKAQNFPDALEYVGKALELKKIALGPTHPSTLSTMGVQAEIWLEMGYLNKALELQNGIVDITKKANDLSGLARSYRNISEIYQRKKDFRTAEEYIHMAIELYGDAEGQTLQKIAFCEFQLGNVMKESKRYSDAISWYKKSNKKHDVTAGIPNVHTASSLRNVAACYVEMGQYDIALKIYKEVWGLFDKTLTKNHHLYAKLWMSMGDLYFEKGEAAAAEKMYTQAYLLAKKEMPDISNDRAMACYHLATITDDTKKALSLCQEGMQCVSTDFIPVDIFIDPSPENILQEQTGLRLFQLKIELLQRAFAESGDRKYLEKALQTIQKSSSLVDLLRQSFFTESAKSYLAENARNIYETGVEIAFLLNEIQEQPAYLEEAFGLMEKSRSLILLEELQGEAASKLVKIPDSIAFERNRLKKEILFQETQIQLAGNNKEKIKELNSRLFTVREKYIHLEKYIDQQFPEMAQLMNDLESINLSGVQEKLSENEVVIEYLVAGDNLYLLKISKNNIGFYKTVMPADFQKEIFEFVRMLKDPVFAANIAMGKEAYLGFAKNSSRIYQLLIGGRLAGNEKNILVIPDLWLSYLPFEILLTNNEYDLETVDYSSLPYLLRICPVHYAFSANLQFGHSIHGNRYNKEILAFAPEYSGSSNSELVTRNGFSTLSETKKEVSDINALLGGKTVTGIEASESNFKENAADFGILHLAMHAFTDEENPMVSGLIFTETEDGEDGILRAYELQGMSLNAQLAVLSACNTGSGKLEKGEGIMSLGRSFRRAGVPNIVMSLWQVDDEATRNIMASFYTYLKDGMPTDRALRQAKLDYLEMGRKTYPFYWSAFVFMGNSKEIDFGHSMGSTIFPVALSILGLFLLIFGAWFFRKMEKKKSFIPSWP